jgi:predicted Zn-dependent protease
MSWMEAVLSAARQAGCGSAEVFVKEGRGRQIALEPSSPGEAPCRLVSHAQEAGAAVRVVDRGGCYGFAWVGLGDPVDPAALVDAALRTSRLGLAPGEPEDDAETAAGAPSGPAMPGIGIADLDLVDPDCLKSGDESLIERLQEAVAEVARSGEAMVEVDRIVVVEAATTIQIATSGGMRGSFDRTLAMLSISLVPAAPEARAVVEERASCRLAGIDMAECAHEAVLRALPERETGGRLANPGDSSEREIPARDAVHLLLEPRAAATLVAALAPAALSGRLPEIRRPSALTLYDDATVAGAPSSAPFDGAGRPTGRRILVEGGRSAGRICATGGHLHRASYRDLPAPGPAALVVAPGARVVDRDVEDTARGGPLVVRAAIVDIVPGAAWVLRVRRGDFWKDGDRLQPADGLVWEGSLARLIQAIGETGDEPRWYQCGVTVCTPSVTLRGLSPLRREARESSPERADR